MAYPTTLKDGEKLYRSPLEEPVQRSLSKVLPLLSCQL